jgi:hypothetical protein
MQLKPFFSALLGLALASSLAFLAKAEGGTVDARTQMAGALLAAPEEKRTDASVMVYDDSGQLRTAREGDGDLICLASDPREKSFKAACYHRGLADYMARGRALRADGVAGDENRAQRWKEVESGQLALPRTPMTLHILSGSHFDPERGEVKKAFRRWVVYVPFATAESTGLSDEPNPRGPWLMHAGTPGAHIMITPPRPKTPE